jgi:hypothetical protein
MIKSLPGLKRNIIQNSIRLMNICNVTCNALASIKRIRGHLFDVIITKRHPQSDKGALVSETLWDDKYINPLCIKTRSTYCAGRMCFFHTLNKEVHLNNTLQETTNYKSDANILALSLITVYRVSLNEGQGISSNIASWNIGFVFPALNNKY